MRARMILTLSTLLLLLACVPMYQNYIRGIYQGSSMEVFPILDQIVREGGFSFLDTKGKETGGTIAAEYERYDTRLQKKDLDFNLSERHEKRR